MAFPKKHLFENEELVLERRPHPISLIPPILVFIAAGVIALVLALAFELSGTSGDFATWVPIGVMLLSVLWLGQRWIKWSSTRLVLTTDRLIYRSGVFTKTGREIPLERINDISSSQTVWERVLRSGDLMIESGGEHGQQRFSNMLNPFQIQSLVYKQIERAQARDMDRVAGRRQLSVPEQIEKLDQLRQQGVLTQSEFDAKKSQLLEKM
jgi:uncharacterized membrane protein YdbT with pleckstrin-like domain